MLLRFLALNVLLASSNAFSPSTTSLSFRQQKQSQRVSQLNAADGAPQYDKVDAVLRDAEKVAEGSYMLHVTVPSDANVKLDYQPGHVLALELEDTSGDLNDDAKNNGGWMRGPYTVSRSTHDSLDVMVRVVGKKSKAFAESTPGTPVRFGGKFKVPILEGINKEEAKKVVLISTGVGVGPCVGAIELALQDESFPPVALFASYRETEEVAYREHLDELSQQNPTKFEWKPVVTSQTGRLSKSKDNMSMVTASIKDLSISDTQYHLIGNGQMVNEWKEGLEKAGVPGERVTVEQYFNHKADTDVNVIETIASTIMSSCAVQA